METLHIGIYMILVPVIALMLYVTGSVIAIMVCDTFEAFREKNMSTILIYLGIWSITIGIILVTVSECLRFIK